MWDFTPFVQDVRFGGGVECLPHRAPILRQPYPPHSHFCWAPKTIDVGELGLGCIANRSRWLGLACSLGLNPHRPQHSLGLILYAHPSSPRSGWLFCTACQFEMGHRGVTSIPSVQEFALNGVASHLVGTLRLARSGQSSIIQPASVLGVVDSAETRIPHDLDGA